MICLAIAAGVPALALAQAQPMYGPSITADTAKKITPAAIAEAKKNNWTMAIAIVDTHGELVYFERMDDVQQGSVDVAVAKARSAARFKRPTKTFQDGLAAGGAGLRLLSLEGAVPVEGGIPLVVGGKIVGAIGASGGTSEQDGVVAGAAVAALK
jgi:glc operon protein GlcG